MTIQKFRLAGLLGILFFLPACSPTTPPAPISLLPSATEESTPVTAETPAPPETLTLIPTPKPPERAQYTFYAVL
ncbi:MAG: hypothetical protein L3J16_07940, partial [Anaerolineales bacterium]|nr:hypothetical protein [Anaerolineales bacterium]